jgi:hypothetical protein
MALRRTNSWLTIGAASVLASCSLIIDKNETQCETDSDCAHFGGYPTCQQGVCVPSGLGPDGCFFGTPTTQEEFANQCTTAETMPFDNCSRLGLCDQTSLTAAMSTVVTPDNGMIPPLVSMEPTPTALCSSLGSVMFITGSTNLPPLIKAVQPLLYQGTPPYIAVFAPQTSCKGAASVYDANINLHYVSPTTNGSNNYAFYYDANGNTTYCLLDGSGDMVDVGESDVFPTSCNASYVDGSDVADYPGPIQAITFVVPSASTQLAISAEAAHLVFGAGGNSGQTTPWIDPTLYFIRSSGTGTIQLPSRAINLMPTAWWGLDRLSASNLVMSMESIVPSDAEASIGMLSNDFADRNRDDVRELFFQQAGQQYGYLPDSTPNAFDKANVRDGHYPIWGPVHLLAATTNGVPSQAASALITQFSVPKLDQNLVSAIITAGFVPPCAMKVSRTTEVGPLSTFQPAFGCGCFFDNQVNGTTTCQTCTGPGDCTSDRPACNYGYCEVQ